MFVEADRMAGAIRGPRGKRQPATPTNHHHLGGREMKTYPYHTPEGIIELVEQREYDELAELALKLANLRAEDMATIKDQNVMLRTLGNALALITEEYEDRRFQFGDEYLWQKHEGNNPLPTAFAALDAYELSKGEQP